MPDFNSREFEYADVKVSIFGQSLDGLRGLTYKKAQPKEEVYGQGNAPKTFTRGNKKYSGTLSILKSDYDKLTKLAVSKGYEDLVDVPGSLIDITCVYQKDKGIPMLSTVLILNVEIEEEEDGMKQGDTFKEVALPFKALKVKKS
jgi:hypothetical protein